MVIEKCQHVCVDNHNYTGMVKKVGPRLRELALTVSGSQDAGSRNLGIAFLAISVEARAQPRTRTAKAFCKNRVESQQSSPL